MKTDKNGRKKQVGFCHWFGKISLRDIIVKAIFTVRVLWSDARILKRCGPVSDPNDLRGTIMKWGYGT